MRESHFEKLTKLTNKKKCRSSTAKRLQTKLWIKSILREENLSADEFETRYLMRGNEVSGVVRKWIKGTHYATNKMVERVEEQIPGSSYIFNLPLFTFLENIPISMKLLEQSISQYTSIECDIFWKFPKNSFDTRSSTQNPVIFFQDDSEQLAQRSDIYGFIALSYLIRRAETLGDSFRHYLYTKDAFRSFPSFARHPHFIENWKEILQLFNLILHRELTTPMLVQPNMLIIEEQIHAKEHITIRALRPIDKHTKRFIMPDLPYFHAKFPFE